MGKAAGRAAQDMLLRSRDMRDFLLAALFLWMTPLETALSKAREASE